MKPLRPIIFLVILFCALVIGGNEAMEVTRHYQNAASAAQSSNAWSKQNAALSVYEAMAVAPNNPDVVYAVDGRLMKSIDGGAIWQISLDPPERGFIRGTTHGLAIDPVNPNILYLGSQVAPSAVIYKSVDQGQSWRQYRVSDGSVVDLAIDPNNSSTIYAATLNGYPRDGIYKSVDGGVNWTSRLPNTGQSNLISAVAVAPGNSNIVFAGVSSGSFRTTIDIYKSVNGGSTWNPARLGVFSTSGTPDLLKRIKVDPGNSNVIYALSRLSGLFKSVDGGATWTNRTPNPSGPISATGQWGDFVLDSTNPNTIYINEGSRAYKSMNGGASWEDFSVGLPTSGFTDIARFSALAISASGQTLYGGGDGVFRYQYSNLSCTLSCSAAAPTSGTVNTSVAFTASATAAGCSGSPNYDWDFGDGSPHLSAQNPSHSYSTVGSYTWRLTVTIAGAIQCVKTGAITISQAGTPPAIVITASAQGKTVGNNGVLDLTVPAGGTVEVSFSATINSGSGSITKLEWRANDALISTQASFKYSFGRGPFGAYLVGLTVENSVGLKKTEGIGINVTETPGCVSPAITAQPANQTINSGQQATLSVTATGTGPLTYQWYRGTSGDISNPIGGAASSSYTTPPLASTTSYWVRVNNACGPLANSNTATITVSQACTPPSILTPPVGQTVNSGQSATLGVVAAGSAPLAYQWYRGASGDTTAPVAGATGSSFVTPPLTATTSYWVRVTNTCGRADSAAAAVSVIAPLALEIIDPACRTSLVCTGDYLADGARGVSLTTNLDRLATAGVARDGATADGVTKLLLRVPSDATVNFVLKKSDGSAADTRWGTLKTRTGAAAGASLAVAPETTASRGKIAFALYEAPLDFPGNDSAGSANLTIEVTLATGGATGLVRRSIALLRPPVVLIHGVWSSGAAWAELERYLKAFGFNICDGCRPDYGNVENGKYKAGAFDPADATTREKRFVIEQLVSATRWALDSYRAPSATLPANQNGYAVTQIDVVAHSMGGLVARARASSRYEATPYLRKENYNQGDFHKIITVGTPHRGTPLANWLAAHKCDRLNFLPKKPTVESLFAKVGYPIDSAVYGFQISSQALQHIGATNVPAHAIVGIAPNESDAENNYNWVLSGLGADNLDTMLLGNRNHDTLVPIISQRGGLADVSVTVVQDVVHAHLEIEDITGLGTPDDIKETASEEVWGRVAELLRAGVSMKFARFTAVSAANTPGNIYPCQPQNLAEADWLPPSLPADVAVSISPSPGVIVRPGAVVSVAFSVTGGNPVQGAIFTTGSGFHLANGNGPFSFSFKAPAGRAGRMDISAQTFGLGPENYEASTFITILPEGEPLALTAAPGSLRFERVGEGFQLRVNGQFQNNSQLDLTSREAGTSYATQSRMASIVSVSPDGFVEARGVGQDVILVSSSGKATSVGVSVSLGNPSPGIAGINPNSIVVGNPGFPLAINGNNFNSDSTVYWNGAPRPTTFVSPSQLMASIAATDVANAGAVRITVFNPAPGGGVAAADFTVTTTTTAVSSVSAASFARESLAAESIVAAFGASLATSVQVAGTVPLPTSLAGTTVKIKDSAGAERLAPLFFVAPSQINYLVPAGTALGDATVTITAGDGAISAGTIQIAPVAPGLFSANASGQGVASGVVLRVKANGVQSFEPVASFDSAQNRFVSVPIDLGPDLGSASDQLFLILFGTGIRGRSSLSAATALLGGVSAEVLFADAAPGFIGLDQVNLRVPSSMRGRGEVNLAFTVDNRTANAVGLNFK